MTHPASKTPVTRLCTHTLTSLHYRDADLVEDLMGKKTFTEVMLMQILGRTPRGVDLRITDVVLIVLMEHGLTPSAIATRLIYMSAPENLQGAVSAGLLAVGSSFVGTMENCSGLLDRIAAAQDPEAEALAIARHYKGLKSPVPGFGHHLHKPVDPRAYKLLEMGRAEPDLRGDKIRALETLSQAVDEVAGRPITINATGAVAAREITAKPRITAVGTPISPSSAATAPVALMVMGRPATSSTALDSVSSARILSPCSSGSARPISSSL